MDFIKSLMDIQRQRVEEAELNVRRTAVMEAIANTKQIEAGLLDAFSDVQHDTGMNRERGAMTHRRRTASAALSNDIDGFATQFIRDNAHLAIQRLLSGKVVGGVLVLSTQSHARNPEGEDEVVDSGPEAVDIGGQFISVAQSSDGTYKMTFNLSFIRGFFGDDSTDILRSIGNKLRNQKAATQLNSTVDFVTLEALDENAVYTALTRLLRELKMQGEEFAFLLITGQRHEEEGEEDANADIDQPRAMEGDAEADDAEADGAETEEEVEADSAEGDEAEDDAEAEESRAMEDEGDENTPNLKDAKTPEAEFSKAWPDCFYGEHNVFEVFYDNDDLLDEITTHVREATRSDDLQECYLGYHRAKDTFVMGFDIWVGNNDMTAAIAVLKLDERTGKVDIQISREVGKGDQFYPKGLSAVHADYAGIIDLRLD